MFTNDLEAMRGTIVEIFNDYLAMEKREVNIMKEIDKALDLLNEESITKEEEQFILDVFEKVADSINNMEEGE